MAAPSSIAGVRVDDLFGPYFSKRGGSRRSNAQFGSDSSSEESEIDSMSRGTAGHRVSSSTTVKTVTSRTAAASGSKSTKRATVTKHSAVEEELRDSLHFLELQLANMRDENAKLKQSYHGKLEELLAVQKVH